MGIHSWGFIHGDSFPSAPGSLSSSLWRNLDGICHFFAQGGVGSSRQFANPCFLLVVSSFAGLRSPTWCLPYALSSFFQNIRPYLIGFDPHDTGLASCNLRSFSLLSRLVFSFHARNPRFFSRRIYACSSENSHNLPAWVVSLIMEPRGANLKGRRDPHE